jgi:hypothetical protein
MEIVVFLGGKRKEEQERSRNNTEDTERKRERNTEVAERGRASQWNFAGRFVKMLEVRQTISRLFCFVTGV